MEAKSGISDLVTNEFENQSPVSVMNQNAAEPRQSISNPQAQQSCNTSEELLGVDESGLAQAMSGMPVADGVSRGGLLMYLNYPWDGSMSMDSIQYAEGDCITQSEHYDDLHRNCDPDSIWVTPTSSSDRNKSTYAPMLEQSMLSPEIATSSTGQTEHGNYIEQKDGLTSTRADS